MSNVRPHGSDNDGPRPHLIIQVDHIISGLAYLSAGRVVTGSFDGTMRIWNVEYGKPEGSSMQHGDRVYRIAATHDRKKLVSSAFFGTIKVWGVESRELIKEWTHPEWKPHIAISPDDRLVAVGNRRVFLHTLEGPGSRQVNQPIKVPGGILCMSFSPNRNKLACGTPDGIRVYNVANGTLVLGPLLPSAKKLSLENRVRGVLWSQNGNRLFSGSDDETIRCWNSNTGEPIGLPWTGHTNWIRALSLSPDGSILASVSANDQTVRFWDSTSGNPIGQPLRHKRRVLAVHFSPSGESVASVGPDKRVYLWRVPRLGTIESQPHPAVLDVGTLQASFPSYFTHSPGAEQSHGDSFDECMLASLTTAALPPTLSPMPSVQQNTDESSLLETVSGEVDLQSFLPNLSLGSQECQRIFELRLRELLDLASSNGLRVPLEFNLLTKQNLSSTSLGRIADLDTSLVHARQIEPLTSMFHSTSHGNSRKSRKIERIKHKLVDMLREIGFMLPKDRLPWSTLEGDLQKKGYTMLNWPKDVARDKDKGVSGLSAEDTNKLYNALFRDERRLQFIRCGEASSERNDGSDSPANASGEDRPRGSDLPSIPTAGNQPRFRVITTEKYVERLNNRRPV